MRACIRAYVRVFVHVFMRACVHAPAARLLHLYITSSFDRRFINHLSVFINYIISVIFYIILEIVNI